MLTSAFVRPFAMSLLALALLVSGLSGAFASTAPMHCIQSTHSMDAGGSPPADPEAASMHSQCPCDDVCQNCFDCDGCMTSTTMLQLESTVPTADAAVGKDWAAPRKASRAIEPAVPPPIADI